MTGPQGWPRSTDLAHAKTLPPSIDDQVWARLTPGERVEAVVATLVDRRAATASSPTGLSPREIEAIDHDQPAPIGTAYRRFLELVGGGVGLFLEGSDAFHPRALGLRQAAQDLLVENGIPFALAPTDRVRRRGRPVGRIRPSGLSVHPLGVGLTACRCSLAR